MPTLTLTELLKRTRAEAGQSITTVHNAQSDAILTEKLNAGQELLATEYRFPELQVETTITTIIGTSTYSFPTDLDLNQTCEVWCSLGSVWVPVRYGIGRTERSAYPASTQSWPVLRWEVKVGTGATQTKTIELWPEPSAIGTIRMTGHKIMQAMTTGTDVSTIDGTLLSLYTAGNLLARQKAADAELVLSRAQRHASNLISRQLETAAAPSMSVRPKGPQPRPYLDYIPRTS